MTGQKESWHLDKRVNVAMILTMVVYAVAAIMTFAQMQSSIETNQRDIARMDVTVAAMSSTANSQAVQLGRIEEQLSALRGDIARMIRAMEMRQ